MIDRTGRLDLLLLGIVERIASRDPVCMALYQTFEPDIRKILKPLDSPRLRRAVRSLAGPQHGNGKASLPQQHVNGKASFPQKRRAKPGKTAKSAKKTASAVVVVTGPDGRTEPVEAEWIQ